MTGKEGHCVFQTRQYSWSSAQNMTKMQLWLICSLIQLSEVAEAWIFFSYFPFFFPTNKSHFVCILLLSFLSLQYRWPRVYKRIQLHIRKRFVLRRKCRIYKAKLIDKGQNVLEISYNPWVDPKSMPFYECFLRCSCMYSQHDLSNVSAPELMVVFVASLTNTRRVSQHRRRQNKWPYGVSHTTTHESL